MGTTRLRRPPAPTAAERARGIATRGGSAALVGTGAPPARPVVHHVRADGSAALLVAESDPVRARVMAAGADGYPAMLELADRAPVDLREPVRGLLWITGTLVALDAEDARRVATVVADTRPDPALLDLGYGLDLLLLAPGSLVVSDGDGTAALTPLDLAAAAPDPFCCYESTWLPHLEQAHPEVLLGLTRHLPPGLRDRPGARVRPLGVDRWGLRLRVEAPDRDHDVRLRWERPIGTPADLRVQLHRLVGCPARRSA